MMCEYRMYVCQKRRLWKREIFFLRARAREEERERESVCEIERGRKVE